MNSFKRMLSALLIGGAGFGLFVACGGDNNGATDCTLDGDCPDGHHVSDPKTTTTTVDPVPVPWHFKIMLVLVVASWFFLSRTTWGRVMYAIGANPEAARLTGVRVGRYRALAYVLSGTIGAFAGLMLLARYGISGNLHGAFPLPVQDNSHDNWDLMVVSHELGHNFGTGHTHDSYNPPIDGCGNGDCANAFDTTIMSYCHLCPGGLSNMDMRFHPRVQARILQFLGSEAGCNLIAAAHPVALDDQFQVLAGDPTDLDVLGNDAAASCDSTPITVTGFPTQTQAGGTLELEDFFTGTIHHLAGDLAGADAALTDGNDWPVYLGADSGAGYTDQVIVLESTLFAGAPGIEGFDLHGYVVTGISVMGTSLSVHNETDFEAGVLFMFRGYRVPGPGGLVCLLAGVGMAAGRRRG